MACVETRVSRSALTVFRAVRCFPSFFLTTSILHGQGSRRSLDEYAPHPLLEHTRVGEGSKHYSAHLPIETRFLRGVSGGELHSRRADEQMLDACERLSETPCLERCLHVRFAS